MNPRLLLAREVTLSGPAGPLVFGGRTPLVTQTMTVAATENTEAVYAEISELAAACAELVRVTVQSARIADSLEPLREKLAGAGITVPLVADIHFSPEAALRAADFVEKVRINPGNFADKRAPRSAPYSDEEYDSELARIHGPVGIDLNSRRPQEIALAVLTDITAARNGVVITTRRVDG